MLAIQAIRQVRLGVTGNESQWRPAGATLIRSLKHPSEVELLRQVYGPRIVIVGVSDLPDVREGLLRKALLPVGATRETVAAAAGEAAALVRRDEKDEGRRLGQRVSKTYELCDVYLPTGGSELPESARRLVALLFGKPFVTPSRDEMGVWHAYAAKFRSSAAGRQVGAVITDQDGELLATGCNDVPIPFGGQNWDGDCDDHRDFALGHDANDKHKFAVAEEMLGELAKKGWLASHLVAREPAELAELALFKGDAPPLKDTRIADLLEFGRIMHAEMAALMTAARRGTPVRGADLYTTTYPCHECMRLIIGAGIAQVVYVDPYPKSLVPELYGGHLGKSRDHPSKVEISPFVGLSPRLVPRVFAQVGARKRDSRGVYAKWIGSQASYAGAEDRYLDTTLVHEAAVGELLEQHLKRLGEIDDASASD